MMVDGKEHFEVERIVAQRGKGTCQQFRVRWLGYDASEDSWLHEQDLNYAPEALEAWKQAWEKKGASHGP